ncbi:unnamed protein product [Phyllotreta striolata]|uniref:Fas-binding factor 1 C-terminal domain-containing protein n=1 Tax=Phyllotreta striolata TaxID=444603 RepID=A0A9N9TID9_PHYSR|nr:unnamed protein product [Phyllotreta striolata]
MDFDLDDPLGSDDSFFEEPKALAKRPSVSKSPEKKTLDSLLGFTSKSAENIPRTETADYVKPKSTVTFEETGGNKKPMEDWLLDSSKPDKHKKSDFLDDILPVKPKPKQDKRGYFFGGYTEGKQSQSTERRRGRRGSGVEDNLGLGLFNDDYQFGDIYAKDKREIISKPSDTSTKATSASGVPDWLGVGSTVKKPESPTTKKPERTQSQPLLPKEETLTVQKEDPPVQQLAPPPLTQTQPKDMTPQNINAEIQNTYSSLHQQESLLLATLQFKKYEETLNEIQEKQQEIIGKQDRNFQKFIDEYIVKQQLVENNIRLQQERINKQIQVLISGSFHKAKLENDATGEEDEEKEENVKKDTFHESLIQKIRARHEEELFLMEESYKKQLDLIEKSSSNVEESLKIEMKNVSDLLEGKVNNIKANYEEEIAYYKEKLKSMEEQHAKELKLAKEMHDRRFEELKAEHLTQIDYIKEMKEKEMKLIDEGQVLSQKIDSGIAMLGQNVKILCDIEGKVNQRSDVVTLAREQSLQSKEQEIAMMRNALEKSRETAENDRALLLSLVRNLELKLAEQNANAQEDRWALQQASATLIGRTKAIEREAEYNRAIIDREKDQLKTLKETLLAEQEKLIMQLTEEKLQLAAEKAKFETTSKLTNSYEVERAKAEAEAAIEEAKQLSTRLNQERHALQRQKGELQALRHGLSERERELEDKEAELEYLMQDAQKKLKEDKHVLAEAKRMESMYKERMKELQGQWAVLSKREKKLAEEKMQLSKERLAIYTSLKASKDCVLCNAGGDSQIGKIPGDNHFNAKTPDLSTMKIRYDAMDEDESEVSKEGSRADR